MKTLLFDRTRLYKHFKEYHICVYFVIVLLFLFTLSTTYQERERGGKDER